MVPRTTRGNKGLDIMGGLPFRIGYPSFEWRSTVVDEAVVFTDGCSLANPGHAGAGYFIQVGDKSYEGSDYLGEASNNVAEYTAVINALSKAYHMGATSVVLKTDSKLVVEQVAGRWRIKMPHLVPLVAKVRALSDYFDSCDISWIPREQNEVADRLSKVAAGERRSSGR